MEIIFLFWIGFAIIVGVAANTRGRDSVGWGVLAVLISPLLAGLLLLALPRGTNRDPRWVNLRSTPMPTRRAPIPTLMPTQRAPMPTPIRWKAEGKSGGGGDPR